MSERFINPKPQYFTASGEVVANGKLYFYDTGTSNPKNTYSDVNLTTLNTNPVILSADGRVPNVFYEGVARAQLTTSDDSETIFDLPDAGLNGTTEVFSQWSNTIKYLLGNLVEGSDKNYYKSLQNDNLSNDPTTSATFWEQVEFTRTWNTNVTYSQDDIAHASDGRLYRSKLDSNSGNDPITDDGTNWGDISVLEAQSIIDQTVTNLGSISTATNVSFETGQFFVGTMAAISTITLIGTVTTNARKMEILLNAGASFAPTFAAGVGIEWEGGVAPTPTAKDIYTFKQIGAGTIYGSAKAYS